MSKQHPKIYISPLLLQQLHEQYSTAEKNAENSTENLSNFCKDATRVFSEALIIKLDAAAVNHDILLTFSKAVFPNFFQVVEPLKHNDHLAEL